MRTQAYFFLLVNTILWGAALVIVKPSLEFTTAYRFLLYRYVLACFFSLPFLFYYWSKVRQKTKHILRITGIELLGTTLALGLLYAGLSRTSAIEAGLLNNTIPIFVALGGVWLLHEKVERHELIGLVIAFLGALLLTFFPLFGGVSATNSISLWGNIIIFLSVACNLFYFPLAKKYYHRLPKLFSSTISFYVALISFFFLSLMEANFSLDQLVILVKADWTQPSVWIASFYMAIFGSIIGLTAYFKGQDGIEASEATLFSYLQPLVYLPLGIFFLGEHLYLLQLVALLIIAGGVFIAERRKARRPRH